MRVTGVLISADTPVGSWRVRRRFGTRGVQVRPPKLSGCHSARSYASSRLEGRWSNVFSRSQGRRRLQKALDARRGDESSQPRAGGERGSARGPARLSIPLCPPGEGSTLCCMKSRRQVWGQRGSQLASRWAHRKNAFFVVLFSPQRSDVSIEGGGCPVWRCLEGSLRCQARH